MGQSVLAPHKIQTRQRPERVPFDFGKATPAVVAASATVESTPRRSNGYDALVGIVTADNPFTVKVLFAPALPDNDNQELPGTFEQADLIASAVDPISGKQTAIIATPVKGAYVKVQIVVGASKLTGPEAGLDLVPIYAYKDVKLFGFDGLNWVPVEVDASGAIVVSGGVVGVSTDLEKVVQVPTAEQTTPLAAGASSPGTSHDMTDYESFGISAFVKAAAGKTLDTTVLVENSFDGLTWDFVDSVDLKSAALADSKSLNSVYSVTRKWYRGTLTNNGADALDTSRFGTILKPV